MTLESEEIKALRAVNPLLSYLPGSTGALYKLYMAIGPEMPKDLQKTPVSTSVHGLPVFHFNYDEGHAGRISVPHSEGASVEFDWVMAQPDPAAVIHEHLTFRNGLSAYTPIHPVVLLQMEERTISNNQKEEKDNDVGGKVDDTEINISAGVTSMTLNKGKKIEQGVKDKKKNKLGRGEEVDKAEDKQTEKLKADEKVMNKVKERKEELNGKESVSPHELTIFIPGLNTVHQPREGEMTSIQRVEHYVRTMGIPLCQVHMGTSFDQGDISIDVESAGGRGSSIRGIFNSPLIPDAMKPSNEGRFVKWDSRQIDLLQSALSKRNLIETPVKQNVKSMLDLVIKSNTKGFSSPLVIVAYSRAAVEVEAALRSFKKENEGKYSDLEERLRNGVTVVTIGCASNNFPDGPAYVHVAAWTDPLSSSLGVTADHNRDGGGKDALFFNCNSPYHQEAFDNHNFGAITAQYVAVIMAINKVSGFRELWQLSQSNNGVNIPSNIDQLTRAMIQLTRGYNWLWDKDAAWRDVPFGALPSDDEAKRVLSEEVGSAFVESVVQRFSASE